jgi:prepilin-type N-terminal cleavage/methylation domain-containing protein
MKSKQNGYTLVEVMIASVILGLVAIAGIHNLSASLKVFQKSVITDKVMGKISERLERYRHHSFKYSCIPNSGCDGSNAEMEYGNYQNPKEFESICETSTFGLKLLEYIQQHPEDLTPIQVDDISIRPIFQANKNDLNITFEEANRIFMKTTIVSEAAGWCK